MSNPLHLSGRFGKTRGWRRHLMLLVLLAGLMSLCVFVYLTRPERLAKLAADLLASMSGAEAHVGSAKFDLNGTIHLQDVQLRVGALSESSGRLFDAPNVVLKHDLLSLFGGRFTPRSLTFIRPSLYLTELYDKGQFNYELLLQGPETDEPRQLPAHLPELFIRGGQIHFSEVDNGQFQTLGNMKLDGVLTERGEGRSIYFFNLHQQLQSGELGPSLSGQFDLTRLQVSGKVDRFLIDGPQRNILPRRLRDWWDQLKPEGSFPKVQFGYDPDPNIGFHAVLEVRDVSMTLPYLPEQTRMTFDQGRFTVANEKIEMSNLIGKVEDFRYVINGTIDGFTTDAAFMMSAKILGVVPDEPHYLPALPENVQKVFNRFTPTGKFKALVLLTRDEPAGKLSYDGQVLIKDAKLQDARFPYPLTDVSGEFKFNDTVVEVVKMTGVGPTGAHAVVRGEIGPPGNEAAVRLTVTGLGIPVDEYLLGALKPKQRPIIDHLLDTKAYAELTHVETGLVKSGEQHEQWTRELEVQRVLLNQLQSATVMEIEQIATCKETIASLRRRLNRPIFELGGKVTSTSTVVRPQGKNQRYTTKTHVDLSGVNILLSNWKYPLTIRSGAIMIERHQVEIENLSVVGLSKAMGEVKGGYYPANDARRTWSPKISFVAADIPVDEMLLASLPPNQAAWIRRLRLEGMVDVAGRIFRSEAGKIDFKLRANVRDAKARPYDGGYPIENVEGDLTLTRDHIELERVTGRHGNSEIALTGRVLPKRGEPTVKLQLSGRRMQLEDPVLDLVPPNVEALKRVEQLFDTHEPTGTFDFDFRYALEADKPANYALELRPQQLDLTVQDQRISLTDITGKLLIDGDGVAIRDYRASYGDGRLALNGRVLPGEKPKIDLTFSAGNRELCPVTRALLPEDVIETIDSIELRGGYELTNAHLVIGPDDAHGSALMFDGTARLTEATASLGVPITEMDGELKLHAEKLGDQDRPRIDLKFKARHLRAADRMIAPVSFRAKTDERRESILIEDLVGECYGGTIVGRGHVDLGKQKRYSAELAAQNVRLDPFREPKKQEREENPAMLSAQLSLRGAPDDASMRVGRGSFEVRDARMYRTPMLMGIMHLASLSLPTSSSFDRAQAKFLVEGDTIYFEEMRFESPSLDVTGQGTLAYESRSLDMDMVLRNPGAPSLGPVSDLFNAFRDELVLIHVGGTLDKPKPRIKSFKGIRRGWQNLFDKVKTKLNQINPLHKEPVASVPEDDAGASTSGQ